MTRLATSATTLALFATACAPAGAPPTEGREYEVPAGFREYTIEQFLGTTAVFGSSFSPDGSTILVSTDETGILNAYAVPVDGGARRALTNSTTESIRVAGYFPDDERFLYLADRGGDELDHVYVQTPDGEVTDLTPGDGLKAFFAGWADDDRSFFVASNARDNRFFDVFEVAVDGYEQTLLYQNEEGYDVNLISPDKQSLILNRTNNNVDNDLYLYDRATGETTHLTPHEEDASFGAQDFGPDGSLYLTTDQGAEFSYLAKMDLTTGEMETVFQPDWDVWYAYFSEDARYLVIGVNEDARTRIHMLEMPDLQPVALPAMGDLSITSVNISDDESTMAFYVSSATSPGDLYVHEIGAGSEPRRLTSSLNADIDATHLVEAEVVRFESYDGLEIPGVLYKPHEARADNPVPAMVWVHGGPGGQSRVGYNGLIQYLVNHGYAVYAINNRGSSGYGKTFFMADDRKHGDADLDDCVASKDMLIATGWVDPDRIGIMGGSYGGYMTLAALTFRPEEFTVGVDIFGISNWHRTVNNIPPWWESGRRALEREMGEFDDEEFFRAKSPLFHADRIVRPLMVLQGANDPRVLQVESDEIVAAVEANGVPVEYVLFPDEGHGFRKKENQLTGYRQIREFLDQYLLELPGLTPVTQDAASSG
ncbi:MAG: S9 family peptidase [Gemmatimonadetes bacterium]|nr:S9 family peptidase [Gemmatimonadota bacterium]